MPDKLILTIGFHVHLVGLWIIAEYLHLLYLDDIVPFLMMWFHNPDQMRCLIHHCAIHQVGELYAPDNTASACPDSSCKFNVVEIIQTHCASCRCIVCGLVDDVNLIHLRGTHALDVVCRIGV